MLNFARMSQFAGCIGRLAASFLLCNVPPRADDLIEPTGLLLRLDEQQRIVVEQVTLAAAAGQSGGLLLWADEERDHAAPLPFTLGQGVEVNPLQFASRAAGSSSDAGGPLLTRPLEQLRGLTLFKGKGFLTPAANGVLANPRITIRRRADEGEASLPATKLILNQVLGGQERPLLELALAANQGELAWDQIPNLPESLQVGLPGGEYVLRDANDTAASVRFTVLDGLTQNALWTQLQQLRELLAGDTAHESIYRTVALSHLLSHRDADGRSRQLVSDAYDLLTVGEPELTTFLKTQRQGLTAQLAGQKPPAETDGNTGIETVDAARGLIAQSRWTEALEQLAEPEASTDARTRGLARLYHGVIAAESGLAAEWDARELFQLAIDDLAAASPADQFRALNNTAAYEFGIAQDRLFNQSFQAASGTRAPFYEALSGWQSARELYRQAEDAAAELPPREIAAMEINLARLYALLADFALSLADENDPQAPSREVNQAAAAEAQRYVQQAAARDGVEPLTTAEGHAVLAHLAYRQGDLAGCASALELAQEQYLQAGSLAGLEATYRLRGLLAERQNDHSEALRRLRVAQSLAEFLYDQVPADQAGLSRAGFFARRAYVNERLLRLAVLQGDARAALRFAEEGKARALQSLMLTEFRRDPSAEAETDGVRTTDAWLADWPAGHAAVEYFLGSEQGWVFVVDTQGEVSVHALQDDAGRVVPAPEIVQRVRIFLTGIEGQAPKMMQRLLAGRGFDHQWQHDLHGFCQLLLPDEVRAKLAGAKSVTVVPHHILHYFPFAALVTKLDERVRKPSEMVQPRFVLDEPYTLTYAPSLTFWDTQQHRPAAKFTQARAAGVVNAPGGPPLPGVEQDLENFSVALGSRVRDVLREEQATDDSVLGLLDRRGALLVASHGFNDPDAPLQSYLLLMGSGQAAETPDGAEFEAETQLTASRIYSSPVRSDLVVLSACYSGLADRSPLPGDDLFGIQRSLLQSGAKTVVSGLWDVYDGTAPTLIQGFWNRIAAGQGAADALADSQREFVGKLRQSTKAEPWLHPYFWGVYTVTGDGADHGGRFQLKDRELPDIWPISWIRSSRPHSGRFRI